MYLYVIEEIILTTLNYTNNILITAKTKTKQTFPDIIDSNQIAGRKLLMPCIRLYTLEYFRAQTQKNMVNYYLLQVLHLT